MIARHSTKKKKARQNHNIKVNNSTIAEHLHDIQCSQLGNKTIHVIPVSNSQYSPSISFGKYITRKSWKHNLKQRISNLTQGERPFRNTTLIGEVDITEPQVGFSYNHKYIFFLKTGICS